MKLAGMKVGDVIEVQVGDNPERQRARVVEITATYMDVELVTPTPDGPSGYRLPIQGDA